VGQCHGVEQHGKAGKVMTDRLAYPVLLCNSINY